ncbi:hypothetical protein DF40_007140 [Stenotrophomonas maltophilia M30]|nr:hypothetical protein DF40_007140 [Stenotrophomonas maltophilia M30]
MLMFLIRPDSGHFAGGLVLALLPGIGDLLLCLRFGRVIGLVEACFGAEHGFCLCLVACAQLGGLFRGCAARQGIACMRASQCAELRRTAALCDCGAAADQQGGGDH